MKFEKLTENKIRVIIKPEELTNRNITVTNIMQKSLEAQSIVLDILSQAEKVLGFYTEGCKLLIEAFSSSDDFIVFTITKYNFNEEKDQNSFIRKKPLVKRKSFNTTSKTAIYKFKNFDEFCNFCFTLKNLHSFDVKKICKNISLYFYNNIYYLTFSDINIDYELLTQFHIIISEFAEYMKFSSVFENKMIEHGKIILKNNALTKGIKYFCK